MNEIYESPKSDIDVSDTKTKGNIWWKICFFVMLLFTIYMQIYNYLFDPNDHVSIYALILNSFRYWLIVFAIFGLAYGKKYFNHIFWYAFLAYVLAIDAFVIVRGILISIYNPDLVYPISAYIFEYASYFISWLSVILYARYVRV